MAAHLIIEKIISVERYCARIYRHSFTVAADWKINFRSHCLCAIIFIGWHVQFAEGVALNTKFAILFALERGREQTER